MGCGLRSSGKRESPEDPVDPPSGAIRAKDDLPKIEWAYHCGAVWGGDLDDGDFPDVPFEMNSRKKHYTIKEPEHADWPAYRIDVVIENDLPVFKVTGDTSGTFPVGIKSFLSRDDATDQDSVFQVECARTDKPSKPLTRHNQYRCRSESADLDFVYHVGDRFVHEVENRWIHVEPSQDNSKRFAIQVGECYPDSGVDDCGWNTNEYHVTSPFGQAGDVRCVAED
jgi:hypothetical protein